MRATTEGVFGTCIGGGESKEARLGVSPGLAAVSNVTLGLRVGERDG